MSTKNKPQTRKLSQNPSTDYLICPKFKLSTLDCILEFRVAESANQLDPHETVLLNDGGKRSAGCQLWILRLYLTGALEASSKYVGKIKKYSTGGKRWVGKLLFSVKMKQKSGWARTYPAHWAPTPLSKLNSYFLLTLKHAKHSYADWIVSNPNKVE